MVRFGYQRYPVQGYGVDGGSSARSYGWYSSSKLIVFSPRAEPSKPRRYFISLPRNMVVAHQGTCHFFVGRAQEFSGEGLFGCATVEKKWAHNKSATTPV